MSMDILHRRAGAGDAIGKGRWSNIRPYEKSADPVFLNIISCNVVFLDKHTYTSFHSIITYKLTVSPKNNLSYS